MGLQVFRVDAERVLECGHGFRIAALQKQDAPDLIDDHTIAGKLAANVGKSQERGIVIAFGLLRRGQEKFGAAEFGRELERLSDIGSGCGDLSFLNQGTGDVEASHRRRKARLP